MKVKELRQKRNLTLRALSELSGVHYSLLSLIENEKAPVTAKTAQKIAKAFGLKKWWVFVEE